DEPRVSLAIDRPARRGARSPVSGLRLVHRGIRHPGPEGRPRASRGPGRRSSVRSPLDRGSVVGQLLTPDQPSRLPMLRARRGRARYASRLDVVLVQSPGPDVVVDLKDAKAGNSWERAIVRQEYFASG